MRRGVVRLHKGPVARPTSRGDDERRQARQASSTVRVDQIPLDEICSQIRHEDEAPVGIQDRVVRVRVLLSQVVGAVYGHGVDFRVDLCDRGWFGLVYVEGGEACSDAVGQGRAEAVSSIPVRMVALTQGFMADRSTYKCAIASPFPWLYRVLATGPAMVSTLASRESVPFSFTS